MQDEDMMVVKKSEFIKMIKKIDFKLIWRGYSILDKLKVIYSFFLLGPLRKLRITKKEILIKMRSDDGILICGDKSIRVANPNYESSLRKYFDLEKGVFIDIGANLGKYTILMAKKLKDKGKVIGIEPEEHNIDLLKNNVKMNGLRNVFIVGKACSDKDGKEILYLEDTIYSGGLHSLNKNKHHVKEKIIEVKKLDSIVSELKIKRVDLIKIDVEGAELRVLLGAQRILKKYHPKIICESPDEKSEKGIRKLLKKFKYDIRRVDEANVFAH